MLSITVHLNWICASCIACGRLPGSLHEVNTKNKQDFEVLVLPFILLELIGSFISLKKTFSSFWIGAETLLHHLSSLCLLSLSHYFGLQVVLIVSGNLSFLNWLTIVPSLACFDDASLGFLFRSGAGAKEAVLDIQSEDVAGRTPAPTKGMHIPNCANAGYCCLLMN